MSAPPFLTTFFSHPQDRTSGDYLHRIVWPGKALGRFLPVAAIQSSHPDHLQSLIDCDVLVINMVADAHLLGVIRKRRQERKVTVFEISDDFKAFPSHLPGSAFYSRKDVQDTIAALASESDAIQFSSNFLRRKYDALNVVNTVFPNQILNMPALKPAPRRRPVLGWAGSIGHFEDARRLADMLSAWPLKQEIQFHIMAAENIAELFRAAGLNVVARPTGDMTAYFDFLAEIDVGIAVANCDDFSSGRSDGKFIEYASRGVVAVCSDGPPYEDTIDKGETGFLFRDENDLLDVLTRLCRNASLRNSVRSKAHQYLRDSRTHAKAAAERRDFYTQLLESKGAAMPARDPARVAGYRELIDDIEPSFVEAMLLHREGRVPEALHTYTRLAEQAPDFNLLWERMGQACAALGATQQADDCYRRARSLLEQKYARYDITVRTQA